MKLQFRFKVKNNEGGEKKVTKTFVKINEDAGSENFKKFAQSYESLLEAKEFAAYLITEENILGAN